MSIKNEFPPCRCHACVALRLIEVQFNPAKYSYLDTLGAVVALGMDSDKLGLPARSLSKVISYHLTATNARETSPSSQVQVITHIMATFTDYEPTEKRVAAFFAQVHEARNDASYNEAFKQYEARKATPEGKAGQATAKSQLDKDLEQILKGAGVVMEQKPKGPAGKSHHLPGSPAGPDKGLYTAPCGHPECVERAKRLNAGDFPDPRFLSLMIGPVELPFLMVQEALEMVYSRIPELRPHRH